MVEQEIKKCVYCQMSTKPPMELLQMTDVPKNKLGKLNMDFCGPLSSGDFYKVVTEDRSRYPEVEVLKSISAKSVIPKLSHYSLEYITDKDG